MLMESLAAGRSISLPSLSIAAAQTATRVVGAYGTIREQFGLPIGRFEGRGGSHRRIGGLHLPYGCGSQADLRCRGCRRKTGRA